MSGVNVDIESAKKINAGIQKLQAIASSGLSSAEKALQSLQYAIQSKRKDGDKTVDKLEMEIRQLEKEAKESQLEYDRQNREVQDAIRQNSTYVPEYNQLRQRANKKKKQLEALKHELSRLKRQKMEYKASKEVFLTEFKKLISETDSGDNGNITKVLERVIDALDEYVHTNFSAEDSASYDDFAKRMREEYQRRYAARTATEMHQEFIRTLGND